MFGVNLRIESKVQYLTINWGTFMAPMHFMEIIVNFGRDNFNLRLRFEILLLGSIFPAFSHLNKIGVRFPFV